MLGLYLQPSHNGRFIADSAFLAPSLGTCLVREVSRLGFLGYHESLRPVFTSGGKDNAFPLQQSSWLVEPFMQTVAIGCFCNQRVLG